MTWQDLRDHLIQSLAAASLLGGGAMLVDNSIDIGKHEARIERVESLDEKLDKISDDVSATKADVAAIKARVEASNE